MRLQEWGPVDAVVGYAHLRRPISCQLLRMVIHRDAVGSRLVRCLSHNVACAIQEQSMTPSTASQRGISTENAANCQGSAQRISRSHSHDIHIAPER